jgi:alkylhydroperoxidase family enzyme
MADIRAAREKLVAALLGKGRSTVEQRRSAFEGTPSEPALKALIDKMDDHAPQIDDADVAAVRAAGFSEDQVFEVVVAAAVGQASRRYESALAAVQSATGKV